jgi:23S rRNA-/tRNA-specific pseudouridylate synthase
VLLVARTRAVAIKLQEMFRGHKDVLKTYWAFVDGKPEPEFGKIKVPLEKTMQNGEEKVVVREQLEGTI